MTWYYWINANISHCIGVDWVLPGGYGHGSQFGQKLDFEAQIAFEENPTSLRASGPK